MDSSALCNVPNRTIFLHDNLEVLQGLNSGCIDLIYLDPPFNKNKKFTAPIGSSAEGAEFSDIFREEDVKDDWLKTIKEDQPELYQYLNGIKGVGKPYNFNYLAYMAIRLIECHRMLKSTGSLYLHCDPTMSHYLKTTLDCIFGEENFRNEIVWNYAKWSNVSNAFQANHDLIMFYSKAKETKFNRLYKISDDKRKKLAKGYQINVANGVRQLIYYDPRKVKEVNAARYDVLVDRTSANPGSPMPDVWTDINILNSQAKERTGYPTQKPLALLDRVINASSNEGDIVLDPFCGCATTCIAAEKVNRQWIGIDVSVKAYELVKRRLDAEVARPHELPMERQEVHLKTNPPHRTDIGASVHETKYVYIISHPKYPDEYKVGIAKDVTSRLNAYQTSDPDRSYKLEFSHATHLYRQTEAYIHEHFENKHEWVTADLEDIKREILNYSEESAHV